MRKIATVLTLMMVTISFGCFAKKKANTRPAWVDNPAAQYHPLQYLSAVGTGSSRAQAADNARANLAKIFQSKVYSHSGYEEQHSELLSREDARFSTQTQLSANVQVLSSQTLSNTRIGPSWIDDLGQVYALAYLHRSSTVELHRKMIEENSRNIMARLARSLENQGIWDNFALLSSAEAISRENQELMAQLSILSSDESAFIRLPYDPQILSAQVSSAGEKIAFRVSLDGEEGARLLPQIREVITDFGFKISETADNEVRLAYESQELNLDNPRQKYIRYHLNITVKDDQEREIFCFTDSGREAHFTFQDARDLALRMVSEKISREFSSKLQGYLESKAMLRKEE